MSSSRLWIVALVLTLMAVPARAAVCSITSVGPVAFGPYDVFRAAPVVSTGSITYECTGVQAFDSVTIEISGAPDVTSSRTMTAGVQGLHYQLYLDAARTVVWGAGAGGTAVYGPVLPDDGKSTSVSIYGRVAAHQDVAAGAYSDTLLVTLQL